MKYAAFFRGINVGGKNKVKMDDLKQLFSDCGYGGVKSYIQSGNVVFDAGQATTEMPQLISDIEHAFEGRFGFHSSVVLRTAAELSDMLTALPFSDAEIQQAKAAEPDVEHVYVYMSAIDIGAEVHTKVCQGYDGDDKLQSGKRELYLLCAQSVRFSRLAANISKLDISFTARNLRTLNKVLALMEK